MECASVEPCTKQSRNEAAEKMLATGADGSVRIQRSRSSQYGCRPRRALQAAAEITKANSLKPLARLHLFNGCRTSTGPVTLTLPATGTSWIQLYQATDLGTQFP